MDNTASAPREVAVPASVFAMLRKELATEVGALPAIHALHAAGYRAGAETAQAFAGNAGEDVSALAEGDFWTRVTTFFSRRGWGSLTPGTTHAAVGLLDSEDWIEAAGLEAADDASCAFSAGLLAGFLSTLAGGPVAVLEVTCRARGDERCSFAFGSESAVHELYGHLLEGKDLEGALTAL